MDKITSGSDGCGVSKDGRLSENYSDNGGSEDADWGMPTEHPERPTYDPDINRVNQDFRNKIRSRHQEEWD